MPVSDNTQARGSKFIESCEHHVLKSILRLFLLSLSLLLLVFNWEENGSDIQAAVDLYPHPLIAYNDYREPFDGEATGFDIRATDLYTYNTYLPIVLSRGLNPKKGVFMTYPPCDDISLLGASWYYDCSVRPDPSCPNPDERFVPLIYSAESMPDLPEAVANAQASGWLMGFNEPNLSWQGHMSPAQAAVLWPQIEAQAQAAGIKLVSPAPSQHNPEWLWEMVDEYRARNGGQSPHFDAIAWHIYRADPTVMQNFLLARRNEALARGYDVPIWVTEYAGDCWESATGNTGNYEIMTVITPWFDSTPWIDRYAWFANRLYGTEPWAIGYQSCSLVNVTTGALNPLGVIYAGY